jgi:hypothetical protein
MITWIRTAKTLPGMVAGGVVWAKEITATVEQITKNRLIVCTTFGGTTGEIAWIGQYDNSAQIENAYLKIISDGDYQAALTKAKLLFIPGSAHDQMWLHA